MCGPQVTGACLPGSRDRATFQRKTNGGEERKTSSGPKETVRDKRGKQERESGRVRGPGDPRQIKESVGGALRETQKVAGAGPETRLDAGGSRDRPGTSGPTAVRPKATASHPKPPGAPLPPRTPLTRSAGRLYPWAVAAHRGLDPTGGEPGPLGVSPRQRSPPPAPTTTPRPRVRAAAESGEACGWERETRCAAVAYRDAPCRPEDRTAPASASVLLCRQEGAQRRAFVKFHIEGSSR